MRTVCGSALGKALWFPLRLWLWEWLHAAWPAAAPMQPRVLGQDQRSTDPNTSAEPISLLQTASFWVFLETGPDQSSSQHVVAIQSIGSYFCSWQTCWIGKNKGVKAEGAVQFWLWSSEGENPHALLCVVSSSRRVFSNLFLIKALKSWICHCA